MGFADPIDFTNVTPNQPVHTISYYSKYTIIKCFEIIGGFLVFNIVILRVLLSKMVHHFFHT